MRCRICDSQDDNITWDQKDGRWRPCFVCQGIITETLNEWSEDGSEDGLLLDEDFDYA